MADNLNALLIYIGLIFIWRELGRIRKVMEKRNQIERDKNNEDK